MGGRPAVDVAGAPGAVVGLSGRRVLVVLLLWLLCACGTGGSGPDPAADDGLDRLDHAVAAVGAARAEVLAVPASVVPVLTSLDDADAAATAGDRTGAGAARAAAESGRAEARAALTDLPARLMTYAEVLSELERAAADASSLDATQRAAVVEVAVGGRQEGGAVQAAGTAAETAWPAYEALAQALDTWLQRTRAGWFRSDQEAAGAYAVLVGPQRTQLDQARTQLARADPVRLAEVDRQSARLEAADAALAPLRGSG